MVIDRRSLLAGAGAILASGLAPRPAAALASAEALVLAPARRADGSFAILLFDENGQLIREIGLPARGHDLAVHQQSGRAVAFARRPGVFAVAFDLRAETEPLVFMAQENRHFFGHGAFSADGRLLFATENALEMGGGVIGVYDATDGYRRMSEFPAHGIGTHEAILMPGGKILAVANGGIETDPAFGRRMLNLPTMDPSLCFVELESGHAIGVLKLPKHLHQLSIRHMAVGADRALWFGTQWEGDPLHTPSLVGRASLESGLSLVETPVPELGAMHGYVGAMAASRDGSIICASAPRGGLIAYWDALSGRMLGTTPLADSSGITAGGSRFLASNGAGVIIDADGPGDGHDRVRRPELSFDNHLRTG